MIPTQAIRLANQLVESMADDFITCRAAFIEDLAKPTNPRFNSHNLLFALLAPKIKLLADQLLKFTSQDRALLGIFLSGIGCHDLPCLGAERATAKPALRA